MAKPSREIAVPFHIGPHGGIAYEEDPFRILVQHITTVCLTRPGERVMVPAFGAGAQDFVFEVGDDVTAAELSLRLNRGIELWEPALRVFDVIPQPASSLERSGIVLDVRFQIPPEDTVHSTEVFFGSYSEIHGG